MDIKINQDLQQDNEEPISMFFDENFVPHAYLDAFFNNIIIRSNNSISITNNNSSLTNNINLKNLMKNSNELLSYLDYYSFELSNELSNKVVTLNNSVEVISNEHHNNNIIRLEYYLDNLSNSVVNLHNDINTINSKIDELNLTTDQYHLHNHPSSINKLIQLQKIKENLLVLLNIFQTI
ncbi:Golgi transport complex subunit COG7 ASCRUDRAFT_36058, partial [Ascoidea rubescens DSM 1968]